MCNLVKRDVAYGDKLGNMFMLVVSEALLENLESNWARMKVWEDV